MPLAFLAASAACPRARLGRRAENSEVGFGLPRQNATGGAADVAAVETEAYAAHQPLHVRLGETRVGAARARRSAFQTPVDAAHEHLAVEARRLRMRLDDVPDAHVCSAILMVLSRPRSTTRSSPSVR